VYLLVRRNVVITEFGNVLSDDDHAYYLKNSDRFTLGLGLPVDIFVSNGTVYACGFKDNRALYWENDVEHDLTDGSSGDSQAASIVVAGGQVHVAGSELASGQRKAKYWLNGVETVPYHRRQPRMGHGHFGGWIHRAHLRLRMDHVRRRQIRSEDLDQWGRAVPHARHRIHREGHGLAVNGSDVFVCGTDDQLLGVPQIATLWTNGTGAELSSSGNDTWAQGLAVVPQ
jgi:hypothetical protein